MTRKLGRLLVVALVVAAVVGPATLSAAIELPTCGGIVYDPGNPAHILYPTDVGAIKEFYDHMDVWDGMGSGSALIDYLNVDLSAMTGPLVVFPDVDELTGDWAGLFAAVRIVGTSGDDVICGYGDSVIKGGRGNDVIAGGTLVTDENVLVGGPGNDTILGSPLAFDGALGGGGADVIYGAKAATGPYPYADTADELYGGAGGDTIIGGSGDDWIGGQGGDDTLFGGLGDDAIIGGAGSDVIHGLATGYDNTVDGTGNFLVGGTGNDTITGAGAADEIRGNAGDDTISTGGGADLAAGGLGNDTITGGSGANYMVGGPGNDIIYGGSGNDEVFGDWDQGSYPAGHPFYGLEGVDTLYGDSGDDDLYGGKGADTLYGGLGNDTLFGNGAASLATSCASGDLAADAMYGGYGNDDFFGAIGDLDRAFEDYEAASADVSYNVDVIPMGNVESVLYGAAVCPV